MQSMRKKLACRRGTRAALGSAAVAVSSAVLALTLTMPSTALATFADCSDGAGNVTDFERYEQQAAIASGLMGGTIDGSEIPDGTYDLPVGDSVYFDNGSVNVVSSSTMCYVKSCVLTVSNGTITATFSLSGAYNYLYVGTAEEAASLTNEDGTDDSAYIAGQLDGDEYFYSIQIPSLNSTIEVATYNGTHEGLSKWWTRRFMFASTDEINEAVEEQRNQPEPDPDPDPDPNPGPGGEETSGEGNGTGSGTGTGSGRGTSTSTRRTSRSSSASSSSANASSSSEKRGILIASISAQGGSGQNADAAAPVAEVKEETGKGLPVAALSLAGGSVALLVGGVLCQTLVFKRRLGGVDDPPR